MKKISLAFCGGGRKGVAYFAFFEEFEKELKKFNLNLTDVIEVIAFSSSAALFTTLYFLGYNFEDFLKEFEKHKWMRLTHLLFASNSSIYLKFLQSFFHDMKVRDLPVKLFYVTLDLKSGKNVMISKGKLVDAVYASTAHPLILPPLKKRNKFLVDGGFTQLLPSKFLHEKGFSNIIGFELYNGLNKKDNYSSYIHVILRSLSLSPYTLMKENEKYCDQVYVLLPKQRIDSLSSFDSLNFLDVKNMIQYYNEAKVSSKRIVKKLSTFLGLKH